MKKQKAITLVALIITMIVLLILATVSISLVINGGIIGKSKNAVDEYSEEEICEQIKMSYLEYEMQSLTNTNLDDKDYLKENLEKIYGEESVKDIKEKNKKYTIIMQDNTIYKYDTKTGEAYKYVDFIDYNGKTRPTLVAGDDIIIGTERFKVFSKTDTEIKAMPYYNLKLNETPIKQATETTANSAGNTSFSSSLYWGINEDKINMNNKSNNIQPYIEDYKTTLEKFIKDDIKVSVARFSELLENGVENSNRNPGQKGYYWVGSSKNDDANNIRVIIQTGNISGFAPYNNSTTAGVRPIIIIPIE